MDARLCNRGEWQWPVVLSEYYLMDSTLCSQLDKTVSLDWRQECQSSQHHWDIPHTCTNTWDMDMQSQCTLQQHLSNQRQADTIVHYYCVTEGLMSSLSTSSNHRELHQTAYYRLSTCQNENLSNICWSSTCWQRVYDSILNKWARIGTQMNSIPIDKRILVIKSSRLT